MQAPHAHFPDKEQEARAAMKAALQKASDLLNVTAELYRDMTLSALRLLPGKR